MKKLVVMVLFLLLAAAPAMAKSIISFPPGYGQDDFNKLSIDAGVALSYTPLAPAALSANSLLLPQTEQLSSEMEQALAGLEGSGPVIHWSSAVAPADGWKLPGLIEAAIGRMPELDD